MKKIILNFTPRYDKKLERWELPSFIRRREQTRDRAILQIESHAEKNWLEYRWFPCDSPPLLLEIKDKVEKLDKILFSTEILSLAIYSLCSAKVDAECFKTEIECKTFWNFLGYKKILKFEPLLTWKDVFFTCLEECVCQSSNITWKQKFGGKGSRMLRNMYEYSDAENRLWLKLKEEGLI